MAALTAVKRVPLLAAMTTVRWTEPEPPSGIPHAFLDATDSPEVYDIGRVVAFEGQAFVEAQWHRDIRHRAEILEVQVQRPVRCRFAVAFDVATYRPFLDVLPRERRLCLVFVRPETADPITYLVLTFERSEQR